MAKGVREIRRKIKSIRNTRQITKAMELVSASKMRKAVSTTLAVRPYANLARTLLQALAESEKETQGGEKKKKFTHPLLVKRPIKNVVMIVMGTDRGLCGSLNTQLGRKLTEYIAAENKKKDLPNLQFIAVGKKVQDFLRRASQNVASAYSGMSNHPTLKDIFPISRSILQDYEKGVIDKVMLAYTDFVSAINQKAVIRRLLPLSRYALEEMIEGLETPSTFSKTDPPEKIVSDYIFEPSPEYVLGSLLPRLTEMQIYQALLESTASEHSARMVAMRNATDSATDIIDGLTLLGNSLRQAAITQELAEISACRVGME